MRVVSLVSARIEPERADEVRTQFEQALAGPFPPGLRETMLLVGEEETAIATLWESREALDALRASGEEPLARRLLREAGGEPRFALFEVAAAGGPG